MKKFLCLFAILATSTALPSETDNLLTTALKLVKDCGDNSMVLCLKERALQYIDTQDGDVQLGEGIQLIKTDDIPTGRSLNDVNLPVEAEARENEVDSLLVDRVARFFGTHTLQFKVPKDSIVEMQRSLEEARGKKKSKKMLLPLLLLFKLKAAALLPLVIGFLALIAFKALIIGKLALLLSGIIGLKKLFEAKNSGQSYEVVSHPHYAGGHEEHGHYARSLNEAHNLAYSAHAK